MSLYDALLAYEDASGSVQVQQLTLMSAYRTLTDAIGGHGDLGEAQARFALEFPILAVMHEDWRKAAFDVAAAVADGLDWQQAFVIPRKRCTQCGDAWSVSDPWDHDTGCNNCFADRTRALRAIPSRKSPASSTASAASLRRRTSRCPRGRATKPNACSRLTILPSARVIQTRSATAPPMTTTTTVRTTSGATVKRRGSDGRQLGRGSARASGRLVVVRLRGHRYGVRDSRCDWSVDSRGTVMSVEIITADDEPAVRAQPVAIADWTPTFVQSIDQAVAQVRARDDFMHKVMRLDLDYGVIPGTGTKPTLLKPGAERLLSAYGLHPELDDEVPPTLDYTGAEHNGEMFFEFRRRCRIWRQTGPGEHERMLVAQASGTCNSWETKYRYRKAGRVCPNCNAEAIIKGKAEFGGGWLCWKKKGGCGEQFSDADARITGQADGRVLNEDVADVVGTVLKMSDKRALVAATIIATGWSDLVTQDIEDICSP